MKAFAAILISLAGMAIVGCNHEEPAEPLSPEAQAALKSGHTGPPPQAQGTTPQAADTSRPATK